MSAYASAYRHITVSPRPTKCMPIADASLFPVNDCIVGRYFVCDIIVIVLSTYEY